MTAAASTVPALMVLILAAAAGAAPAKQPARASGWVAGRAVFEGKAAAGCRVFLYWSEPASRGWKETTAGPGGEFRFAVTPGRRQDLVVTASAPDGAIGWSAARAGTAATVRLAAPAVLTGRLLAADGTALAGAEIRIGSLRPTSGAWPAGPDLLPPALLRRFVTKTDASGDFRLPNVPTGAQATLSAPGGPVTVSVRGAGVQPVGILVERRPGTLRLRGFQDGKPAGGGTVWIRRLPRETGGLADLLARRSGRIERFLRPVRLDPQGAAAEPVAPGRYELAFHGMRSTVEVGLEPGEPVRLERRAERLRGVVQDAAGKPAAARLVAAVAEPALPYPALEPVAADAEGRFELPDFPWEADRVTVRAVLGTAEAAWTGSPRELTEPLSLTLRAVPVLTVRGRIVHEGKPLPRVQVALFVRDPAGAARALAAGVADDRGRFSIPGLRRGVVFMVGTVQQQPDAEPRVLQSAPVPAPDAGEALELGDVTLSPYEAPNDRALQIKSYLPAGLPPAAEEAAAADAFQRFLEALRSGNAAAARDLTSRLDPAFGADLPDFLRSAALHLPGGLARLSRDRLHPVRVLPSLFLAGMYDAGEDVGQAELIAEMRRPDWLLLAFRDRQAIRMAGLMHRESGGWKLLGGLGRDETAALNAVAGDETMFGAVYSPVEEAAPLEAARAYWSAWSAGDRAAQARLTAGAAPPPPGGAPPGRGTPEWAAERRFSEWDLSLLFGYPRALQALRAGAAPARTDLKAFPHPQIRNRDLAVLGYAVEDDRFLTLLVRENGAWRIVDPAFPLGLAKQK